MMKLWFALILLGLTTGRVLAQPTNDTPKTNGISVDLWIAPTDKNPHAPATIHMVATVSTTLPGHAGDTLKVNFLANSKYLGSGTCTWHEGHRPDPNSPLPQPLVILRPGYSGAQWTWQDVPAGKYSLTATLISGNGLATFSEPKQLTVLP